MRYGLRPGAWWTMLLVTASGLACDSSDPSPTAPVTDPDSAVRAIISDFGLAPLPSIPYPDDNRHNPSRIALGQLLFFDPILGGESAPWVKTAAGEDPYRFRANDMACATCHHPTFGFADGRPLSAGVSGARFRDTDLGPARVVPGPSIISGVPLGIVPRNAPSIFNTAFNGLDSPDPRSNSFMFLDGRVTEGLEAQAILPITSRDEMAGDAYGADVAQDSVTARIRAITEYVARFAQAFAGEINDAADLDISHIGRAIAAYEREIITPGSRYDRFVSGEFRAFNDQERLGFEVFFGKGLCGDCHSGPMLSDFTMRVQGVGDDYESVHPGFEGKNGEGGDFGRFHADPDQFIDQKYAFRTLTVRMVEQTGPYFHSGSARTLREAVEFYNRGGLGPQDISDATLADAGVVRDPSIRPLDLTSDEMDAIVAFMKTTTAPVRRGPSGLDLTAVPERVPSGLLPPGIPTPDRPGPYLSPRSAHPIRW
ncbi:MAG: hypothetical protein OEO23_08625 [Gemmatimonadota bacterium]|nr:hypothetical protein [Gemmatimonadota bacterium]